MNKPIRNYEGLYEIDELGNVYSLKRHKIMSPTISNSGYKAVVLSKDKHKAGYLVHRLVAEALLQNPDNLPCVNHKDEDKLNNSVDNLEWCTYQYNNSYKTRGARISKAISDQIEQYTLDGTLVKEWKSMIEVQRVLGFDRGCISRACNGQLKTYKSFIWKKKLMLK